MEPVTSEEPYSFTRLIVAKGDFLCANKNAVKHLYFLRELEGDPNKTLASDSVLCTRPFLKVSSKAGFGTLLFFLHRAPPSFCTQRRFSEIKTFRIIRSVAKIDNEHLNEFGPLNVPLDNE